MSEISDIGSILTESLLLNRVSYQTNTDRLKTVQEQLKNLPNVLDEETLTRIKNGEYEITLREYTGFSTYNTVMTALYGDNSADKFQNILNIANKSAEDNLSSAKAFVDKMKKNGMSNSNAVKTYAALQKYSLMSSFGNYNFIKATV